MIDLALNPFKKGKKTEVEAVHKIAEVEKNPNLEAVIKIYSAMKFNVSYDTDYLGGVFDAVNAFPLTPPNITAFLEYIKNNKVRKDNYMDYPDTGYFINNLISNAYERGHNNFVLNTGDFEINLLLKGLKKAKDKDKPNITILGNVGSYFAGKTENCKITVTGDVGCQCGSGSKKTKFYIGGSLGNNSGYDSLECLFTVKGNVDASFGSSSIRTIYRVYDKEVFDKLSEYIPRYVRLLDADGKVIRRGNE